LPAAWVCAAAIAGQPAVPPPPAPPAAANPSADAPDDGFIEFLGADDVEDAAWWEFFKKAPPHGKEAPVTPPQDAKQ